jgi:ring-1,2-phenylacetyl-CoA epoxidase subunit PaaE
MAKFYPLKVQSIVKETDECTVLSFDVPEELKANFNYTSGQHLTLKTNINGNDIRRSYSLCSSPLENKWNVAVKQIPDGLFSTYANTILKENDTLEVMPPSGLFGVKPDKTASKNYVFFAAGSGITPIISMIKTHLEIEPNSSCQLFYLNKNAKSIIFKEELEQIRNKYFGRLEIFYFLTREQRDIELFNGRFTPEKIEILSKTLLDVEDIDECFICGPEEMIFMISDELQKFGVAKDKIHFELFFTGASKKAVKPKTTHKTKKENAYAVTIIDGGKEFHFDMDEHFENVLDAALDAGMDLPFACKGGVCSTCKCKVLSGNVDMKINYALEKEEVEQNYVLSCQSKPTTKEVVLDFDV